MENIRIQKGLSQMGICSRREAEEWIRQNKIKINGSFCKLGMKFNPESDDIWIEGVDKKRLLTSSKPSLVYWMLNKPVNYLSSRSSQGGKPTIFDLPSLKKIPFFTFSVGRLDYKTQGLLLITNDGNLANKLTHPNFKIPKHYQVLSSGKLTAKEEEQIRKGLPLEDGSVAFPCDISYVHKQSSPTPGYWYLVTVYEGRNRLVRRLFENTGVGYEVKRLIRYGIGPLRLPDNLKEGEYKQLTHKEVQALKAIIEDREENLDSSHQDQIR